MKFNIKLFTIALLCSFSVGLVFSADLKSHKLQADNALHMDWLDPTISPAQDFYTYANGNWQKNNPIPPEYSSWGSFNSVSEKMQTLIHQMLIAIAANTKVKQGSIEQKVGDFYFSGMDEGSINQLGIKPLQVEFDRINALKNLTDLQNEIAHLHQIGINVFFGFCSMQDYKNSKKMIATVVQGGLGLPNRDYYLQDKAKFKQIREAYVAHMTKMFELLGDAPQKAATAANTVMKLETQLAQVSMSPVEQRNPHAIYHIMDQEQLAQITPGFSWPAYFAAMGQNNLKSINVAMPDFFKALGTQLNNVPLHDWQIYLRWHLIDDLASYLSKPFVDENFKMLTALTGTEKILPRWKRVVATENGALGFAIGKMYVDRYFSAAAKQQALDILKNIRFVLREDISNLAWMKPETRQAALKKLDLMEERVGYPSKWWDYSSLKIDRGSYVLNVIRANQFLIKRDLDKIGKSIDRSEWAMAPQTVNAYYDSSMNNLNIPAGILQAPFFDPKAPAAVNYGAIGFVMGHEMTHGFDDQGGQFDGNGNLKNWWTPSDLVKFKAATQCIIDQFSHYAVNEDMYVQGKLVVGEATADLGGITIAYRAFHHSNAYKNAKTIDGMSPDKQFFLGAAHVWAMNIRPQQLQNQVTTDPHPPAKYRVNGSLANIPQFQSAFNLPDGSSMVNKQRCVIW
ncbi:M13 family metallopeptidase [Legionella sp.]|uniref:M13 family metallopeptidase n=1 Tax=Legionella sp. TaxID=459 RepID=UPI003CBDF53A